MECPNCNGELKVIEDKVIAEYLRCDKCGHETVHYAESCCLFPRNEPVFFYKDRDDAIFNLDNYLVFNQCKSCGRKNGSALKKSDFKKEELTLFDYSLAERLKELKAEISEHVKLIEQHKRERKRDTFWDDYEVYLKSDEWKAKRELVLKRDKYVCQSCLSDKATQVHHTIGIFRKNEPLFTLVSVCERCHRIITDIERGNHLTAEKIRYTK